MNYQNKDNLVGALLIAGYDDERGGQVFGCPIGGTLVKEAWAIDGSGSTFIWGFCDAEYRWVVLVICGYAVQVYFLKVNEGACVHLN